MSDEERINQVGDLILEADTLAEMLTSFRKYRVNKVMYFLQHFVRESRNDRAVIDEFLKRVRERTVERFPHLGDSYDDYGSAIREVYAEMFPEAKQ